MQKRPVSQFKNLIYEPEAITFEEKKQILEYLATLHPIWEMRYSKNNPPPTDQAQRRLLRPVYWLGNWQFACLNYYHPPKGIHDRCVSAEPYPPVLQQVVDNIESKVHQQFDPKDVPRGWHLNTCLINFYGDQIHDGKRIDCARVGEHKDFEPGPVASVSFGEKALFQFVESKSTQALSNVILQQWLEDRSLQIFGGDKFKKQLFHRVQRVETKANCKFKLNVTEFETRRINFTFRYVPDEHIQPYFKVTKTAQEDTLEYVQTLAQKSAFFERHLQLWHERTLK
ncbi:MAG: alpha-ketoglutarate-dependent dioxygenase AlkB [Bdellovibrionaceae bacterium]|nr:alpha-ketoglutarate-dependent dioxygenase AlkB [Pseudobdellovibrionaceae bacterium]